MDDVRTELPHDSVVIRTFWNILYAIRNKEIIVAAHTHFSSLIQDESEWHTCSRETVIKAVRYQFDSYMEIIS